MKIGLNGAVMESGEAVISVYDHGFLYGMGLFETFRTYGGKPYLLERHMKRLAEGCEAIGIRYKPDPDAVRGMIDALLRENGLAEGYIRLTVTAGTGELGLPPGDYEQPTEFMLVKALPPHSESLYSEGKELRLLNTARNTPEGTIRLKSLHYMNNIIAKRELLASDASPSAEGLMLSHEGLLAEGIVSNVFFVQEDTIYTPSTDIGILPGITRQRVIELARGLGYAVREGHYLFEELLAANEVWLTTSIQELVPVTRVTDHHGGSTVVGSGTAGPVLRELLLAYREDTEEQQR
ncbi:MULTISPECIES: aminodeoxychorismate lyase [unclassified Paenibacillus]|uniref:aminodeoxychorismate lyase n=1 Tax=unclassified Paenibacillus TaxID=185978 RepID=UPI001052A6DB|nr:MULTISPECIES: aminodeoxychorismate lyase [unclassified Paenibacillus]NIK72159.1 4-amino-4-deoxychorismate lyase [Paenibacillus sp. BK720]TCM88615.1 4-amino-4-deoxychorismate lyase [Paenibacillus sp. BK033]